MDLGKRNRLLNYRDTARSNVKIEYPDCSTLWDMFVKDETPLVFPFTKEDDEDYDISLAMSEAVDLLVKTGKIEELEGKLRIKK